MNKLTFTALLITFIFFQNQFCQSQCHFDDLLIPQGTDCRMNDSLALVALYNATIGSNWKNTWNFNESMDNWDGVTMNTNGCVIELNLAYFEMSGSIPAEIGELSHLQSLSFYRNNLAGSIPREIGNLKELVSLNLGNNQFSGKIPPEIGNLTKLKSLSLIWNSLVGDIPPEIGNLTKLTTLSFYHNNLIGSIPPEIGNLKQLKSFDLRFNKVGGNISAKIWNLNNLVSLYLSNNQLSGSIPFEVENLTELAILDLSENQFTGNIPPEIGNLTNLTQLYLSSNQFKGNIPPEIANLNGLTRLSVSNNNLTGSIPPELGNKNNLTWMRLNNNDLSGCYDVNLLNLALDTYSLVGVGNDFDASWDDFMTNGAGSCSTPTYPGCRQSDSLSLVALHNVTNSPWNLAGTLDTWQGVILNGFGCVARLDLGYKLKGGIIPADIGNLSQLVSLDLDNCHLGGNIPVELGNLSKLTKLNLSSNDLTGNIPSEFGNLNDLEWLELSSNQLTGNIPSELGSLNRLKSLDLSFNKLMGNIPLEIGNLQNLIYLELTSNDLAGNIPFELENLSHLKILDIAGNDIDGSIPAELGNLSELEELSLGPNGLTGNIPPELGNLNNLEELNLRFNQLTGSIPPEFGNLSKLTNLQLNKNQLSGNYDTNLLQLCNQFRAYYNSNDFISDGNNFDVTWEDFCAVSAGACPIATVSTIYSGDVTIELNNNQNILKNDFAIIYDFSTCSDYNNIQNCAPVSGFNNLAANEALWVVSKAAEYLLNNQNIKIPTINIIVNNAENPNDAKYNPTHNTIILGKGDGIERNSMSAPDIIAHEYAHAFIHEIKNLGNYKISGAFNESYADIFGELVEHYSKNSNDWIYGNEVMINAAGNKAGLRNLANTKDSTMKYQLPNTYKGEHWIHIDNVCFHIDNCGIHSNSGVHSYWFYLLVNGGSGVNDNGHNFNVTGIGLEKASAIIFDNLRKYLNPQSTFTEAREGSICAAQMLYANQPDVLTATKQAWDAVGVYEPIDNPIEFRITNAIQTDGERPENGQTVIPVQFDLSIDSLGMDISADGLCFTLHKPKTYMEMNIDSVYTPLTDNTIKVVKTDGEISICINRQGNRAAKNNAIYPLIASDSPILKLKVCIVTEDIGGEGLGIEPIEISGSTKVGINEEISFRSATLPFSFDYDGIGNFDPKNKLNISLTLNQKNCHTLGAVELEVLDNYVQGVPPYTYSLKDVTGINPDKIFSSDSAIYQLYNLEEGAYEVKVTDSNPNIIAAGSKKFSIKFAGKQSGSICCAEKLIIPPGVVSGTFNTSGTISLSDGVIITEGAFEICK